MVDEFKNYLKQMFMGGVVQPRALNTIPTTMGMPEGTYYTDDELKHLYSKFGRFSRDMREPWNEYYGAPNYIFSAPQWLINRDEGAGYHGTSSSLRDVMPTLQRTSPYVIRRGIQPY